MTKEEAINWLKQISDRHIHGGGEAYDEKRREAIDMAIFALGIRADMPPDNPLTLEELREMDGEPVWVVGLNGYPPRWGLVYWCRKSKRNIVYVTINNGASVCAEAFMAAGEKIYRRKPKGD